MLKNIQQQLDTAYSPFTIVPCFMSVRQRILTASAPEDWKTSHGHPQSTMSQATEYMNTSISIQKDSLSISYT